jgi:hypothetical protein
MTAQITAASELHHAPQVVFDSLADLRNHALLAPGWVELRSRDLGTDLPVHAIVRLRGPLAMRRTATTAIVDAREPAVIAGRAGIGKRTRASISWTIAGQRYRTSVSLRVIVEETAFLDGVVLRLGGRRWLQRRLAHGLVCLGDQLDAQALPSVRTSARTGASLRLGLTLEPAA